MKLRKMILVGLIALLVLGPSGFFSTSAGAATITYDSIEPVLLLEKVSTDQAVAGSEFNISLVIRNISSNPAFDLELSFKIQGETTMAPFAVKSGQSTTIDKIEGNQARTVLLTLTVAPQAQNKDYKLVVNISGKNARFEKSVNLVSVLTIPVSFDMTKPVLLLKSAEISPENPDLLEGFDVTFKFANLSKTTDARNVLLLLDGTDNFEVMDISNKQNIPQLPRSEERTVTYRLRSKDTKSANTVKLKVTYDYLGDKTETVEETVNLPLPREEVAVGATPWVIVKRYTLSDEKILAGNVVSLTLDVENTNQRPVKNVKISLGVVKIEATTGTTTSTTTGGTVFSPVNSSNSFFIDYIPGKTVVSKTVDLYVDPNAAAKTYIVPVEINYEDRTGKALKCEELVNIPVTQECKLNVISVQAPPVGFVGQAVPVTAEFVNVGKVILGNFMVTLEGDFEKENGTYYVGNLDIGMSDFFQGMLIPTKEGTVEGKLVFSYIDNNNKDVRVEHPLTMEIQQQSMPMGPDGQPLAAGVGKDGMSTDRGMPVKEGSLLGRLAGKWPLVLLALIIVLEGWYIWRLRRRKAKADEEFFNE